MTNIIQRQTAPIAGLLLLMASAASADDSSAIEQIVQQACGNEQLANAEAACVGLMADTRMLDMDMRIAGLTATLQAASPAELARFERGLVRSQANWRSGMEADCEARALSRGAMPAGLQICRLAETLKRRESLEDAISGEFAQLAGTQSHFPNGVLEFNVPIELTPPTGPEGQLEIEIPLSAN